MPFKSHPYSVHREQRSLPLSLQHIVGTGPTLIARCLLCIDTDGPQSRHWAEEISGVTLSLFPMATSQGV